MTVTAQHLFEVCDETWPAARRWVQDPWVFRDGQGGGQRVSAATATRPAKVEDVTAAEQVMRGIGQAPLFMIREEQPELDALLAARGYRIKDPVVMHALPIAGLTDVALPRVTAFCIWEPLAIMTEIWAAGGVGPARLAVMARAREKTAILARWNEKPAGTGFAAIHDGVCMVHAVEVLEHQRRQGVAQWIMRAAAHWAAKRGAQTMSVLCTVENVAANRLYSGLGFVPVGRYHYRTQGE